MKYCDATEDSPRDYKGYYVWCQDHNLPASHCGPDGDTPVCEVFSRVRGCNDCKERYRLGEKPLAEVLLAEIEKGDDSETGKMVLNELTKMAREKIAEAMQLSAVLMSSASSRIKKAEKN